MVGRGRARGQTLVPDDAYKYFRVTSRDTGILKPVGAAGGPSDRAECIFCEKDLSCQKNRLLSHLGGIPGPTGTKSCLGPGRSLNDTDASYEKKIANFNHARQKIRTRIAEEYALQRKRTEVCPLDFQI